MSGFDVNIGANTTRFDDAIKRSENQLQRFSRSSNSASFALINLGRVAQDAPYGFIGIANNLNPLLESFQRLRSESGSTGGALKALGSSIMGAGGVGLALSAFTAIAQFATLGLTAWTRGIGGAKNETESLDEKIKLFNKTLEEQKKGLDDVTDAFHNLLRASKISIDLNFKKGGDLLFLQGQAATFAETILPQIEKDLKDNFAKISQLSKDRDDGLVKDGKEYNEKQDALFKRTRELNEKQNQAYLDLSYYQQQIRIQEKKDREESIKDIEDYQNKRIQLAQKIFGETKNIVSLRLDLRADDDKSLQYAKAEKYLADYFSGRYKIKVNLDFSTDSKPFNPDDIKAEKFTFDQVFYADIKEANKGIEQFDANLDSMARSAKKLEAQRLQIGRSFGINKDTNEILNDTQKGLVAVGRIASDVFVPAFESIANAVFEGKNAFEAFGKAVANALKQVFAQLLGKAALAGILSILFPGGLGGVKGFGAIFKGLLGFADGGSPPVGVPSIVGERGPELFIPSTSGRIIPNNQLSGLQGSAMQLVSVRVEGVIDGRTIRLVQTQQERYERRNG